MPERGVHPPGWQPARFPTFRDTPFTPASGDAGPVDAFQPPGIPQPTPIPPPVTRPPTRPPVSPDVIRGTPGPRFPTGGFGAAILVLGDLILKALLEKQARRQEEVIEWKELELAKLRRRTAMRREALRPTLPPPVQLPEQPDEFEILQPLPMPSRAPGRVTSPTRTTEPFPEIEFPVQVPNPWPAAPTIPAPAPPKTSPQTKPKPKTRPKTAPRPRTRPGTVTLPWALPFALPFAFPRVAPSVRPRPLTLPQSPVLPSPSPVPDPLATPMPQFSPARPGNCPPCPKAKKKRKKKKLRTECYKGLYREGRTTDDVDFTKWAQIDCSTGREL